MLLAVVYYDIQLLNVPHPLARTADLGDYESMDADIEYMCDEKLVSNEVRACYISAHCIIIIIT